jgi:hypothetical protein
MTATVAPTNAAPKLPRREFRLTRGQMFRALPKHLGWAALTGALAGVLLYFINQIQIDGLWSLILFIPIGAVYVNAAILPAVIPGRFWSFGYIGMMLLFLLLIIGAILSNKILFPHATAVNGTSLQGVNFVTFWAIMTGSMLGLLYGLLAGRTGSMIIGLMLGSMAGYLLGAGFGMLLESAISDLQKQLPPWVKGHSGVRMHDAFIRVEFVWWQMVLAIGLGNIVLHLAALSGAALGADRIPIIQESNKKPTVPPPAK